MRNFFDSFFSTIAIAACFVLWTFPFFLVAGLILALCKVFFEIQRKKGKDTVEDIEKLIEQKNSELAAITDQKTLELSQLDARHQAKVVELAATYKEKDERLLKEHEATKERLAREATAEHEAAKERLAREATAEHEAAKERLAREIATMDTRLKATTKELQSAISSLEEEIEVLAKKSVVDSYDFSDYDALTSEECKNKLALLKTEELQLVKVGAAITSGSAGAKKQISDNIKQALRCFNAECDNILLNLSAKSIDASRSRTQKAFETINKIFESDKIHISSKLLELKLESLNLVYTAELKKEQERAEQKAIREQMLEEEKVRREIEREKIKIGKEEAQFRNEVSKLMKYLQKTNSDVEKQLYLDKIQELEEKLKLLEKDKSDVFQREQNTRAGFVYVISNVGSFGEDVYKIGMTRRLEPMDRISELSSASVPFPFDVHAMIFSEDAPKLETTLHQHFRKNEVNKINSRKEFFNIALNEIESVVKEHHNATVQFTMIAAAKEYRDSLLLANV